jgi:hypothetical protein
MKFKLWYCSNNKNVLLESIDVEDKGHKENLKALYKWAMMMMDVNWLVDDYEQFCYKTSPDGDRYFLANTETTDNNSLNKQ